MSEIVVAGLGIVTAMGIGVDKNIHAIRNNLSGISSRPVILDTNLKLPVGEILLSNRELSDMLSIPICHVQHSWVLWQLEKLCRKSIFLVMQK